MDSDLTRPESLDPEAQDDLVSGRAVRPTPTPKRGWILVLATTILGAVVGLLATTGSTYSTSALVQAAPVVLGGVDTSDSSATYVRTELLFTSMYEPGMRDASDKASGLASSAPVTVTLRTGTTIMFFDSNAPTAEQAAQVANASARYYVDMWRKRTVGGLERSIAILDNQLAGLPIGSGDAASLESQKVALQTELASVRSAERIVSTASSDEASQNVSLLSGAILGALAGFCAGLGVLLLMRRRHRRRAP